MENGRRAVTVQGVLWLRYRTGFWGITLTLVSSVGSLRAPGTKAFHMEASVPPVVRHAGATNSVGSPNLPSFMLTTQ